MKTSQGIMILVAGLTVWSVGIGAETMDGKTCYQKKMCAACHGAGGEGSKIAPTLKNLAKSKDQVVAILKNGTAKMKPVKGTDEELAACADYVLTLK